MSEVEIEWGDSYLPLASGHIRDRFVLLEGPRGTSKTTGILSILLMRALRYPGSTWLLARSTRTRLTDTVLVTLEEQVFPRFKVKLPGNQKREGRHVYRLPNGSSFVTMGLDDPQRTTSAEFAGIYVAEAIEIESAHLVEALAGSMRQARRPEWDSEFFHQCLVDTNPGSPAHWLNQIAEPVDQTIRRVITAADYQRVLDHNWTPVRGDHWKRIITKHQDNPYYFDPVSWQYTMPGAEYVNDVLAKIKSRHLRRRWLDGDWVAAEGTVFPEFSEERHVIDPFDVPTDIWPSVIAIDPGYDHPAAAIFMAIAENDTMYIFDEVYGREMGVDGLAPLIKAKMKGRDIKRLYADPQHAFRSTFDSPESIAEQFLARHGLSIAPWPKSTDKESMVENFRRRIVDGKVKVTRNCVQTIGEFQSWSYKRDAKGRIPSGDDQYEDKNNHAMDAILGYNALGHTYGLSSSAGVHQTLKRKTDPQVNAILQATLPSGMTPKELDRLVRGNLARRP